MELLEACPEGGIGTNPQRQIVSGGESIDKLGDLGHDSDAIDGAISALESRALSRAIQYEKNREAK